MGADRNEGKWMQTLGGGHVGWLYLILTHAVDSSIITYTGSHYV